MMTPFEQKSRLGGRLDGIALRLLVLALCFLWFYRLWGMTVPALLAGLALCALLWRTLTLWQRRALTRREAALRAHIGGTLALESLLLCTPQEAALRAADWLASEHALEVLRPAGEGVLLRYGEETLLLLCLQHHPQHATSASDVLAASRACLAAPEAARCVLCSPGTFSPEARQVAESLEPPVRLIDGEHLCALAGRIAPAGDEQLVAMGKKQRKPFAWASLRPLVFSAQKARRYAAYGAGLLVFYILTDRLYYLLPAGLCLLLSMLSHRQKYKPGRL